MQVFTTIFLAEKFPAGTDHVEETGAQNQSALIEFENARECIVTLEARNWFVDDAAKPLEED